ncbi:MAG: hypothetical protein IIY89_09285 [Clostridia bacterium]|nr:hypothetical protein [Clostridia bacterium]
MMNETETRPVRNTKGIGRRVLIIVLAVVLALVFLTGSLVVTRQDEYTVIKQFGAVVRVIDQPGPSLKIPFIQTTQRIPKTLMLYDLEVSDVIPLRLRAGKPDVLQHVAI